MDQVINQKRPRVKASPIWEEIRVQPWIIHTSYWIAIVLFFGLFWGSTHGEYANLIFSELVLLPTKIATAYMIMYVIIPKYLLRQKYIVFIAWSFLIITVFATVQRVIAYNYLHPWKSFDPELSMFNIYEIMHQVININTALILPIGFKLVSVWMNKKLEAKDLEKQNLETELKFLKHQLQPHFLFNTLNNLYGLILQKSELAKDVTLKLSSLMRYTLYETNVEKVELEKEIGHIKNYIDLEKIRHQDRLDVSFSLYGRQEGLQIAPMLILHFVENSFKHSLGPSSEKAWISLDISTQGNSFILKIENSKPKSTPHRKETSVEVSGIGLENVQRQLDLLYQNRHTLKIEDLEDSFMVVLKLDLSV